MKLKLYLELYLGSKYKLLSVGSKFNVSHLLTWRWISEGSLAILLRGKGTNLENKDSVHKWQKMAYC